jgi:hypothetical protein
LLIHHRTRHIHPPRCPQAGISQELEDGLDFGDDEGEELTIEEAEEGARAFDAAQVHQQTAPATPHQQNRTHQMT